MTFNRMYRHQFKNEVETWPGGIAKYATNTDGGGWFVLPIQNSVTAAMRPRDWQALNAYFCKWRIKGFKVECSNFNAQELRPVTGQSAGLDATTIPNLYFECYVDADHLLPGYEQDFMRYATNNGYATADATAKDNNGDIDLRKWHFINTLGETIYPYTELDLPNGPGYKFIKMTDNFDFSWSVDEKERRWRHTGQPWQYQLNEAAILQRASGTRESIDDRDISRDRSYPFQGNLSWGGFPGGRTDGFRENYNPNPKKNVTYPVKFTRQPGKDCGIGGVQLSEADNADYRDSPCGARVTSNGLSNRLDWTPLNGSVEIPGPSPPKAPSKYVTQPSMVHIQWLILSIFRGYSWRYRTNLCLVV